MDSSQLNAHEIQDLLATLREMESTLESSLDPWPAQLKKIRNIITNDISPDGVNRDWQIAMLSTFQYVAFADADNGMVQDVADWCLRQALIFVQEFPQDVEFLALIGRNWLLRAQKALASIDRAEIRSSSSEEIPSRQSIGMTYSLEEREARTRGADYVEARGILVPATDYLARAVVAARAQGNITGQLLSTAAEAFMSRGNVTSPSVDHRYFQQALSYLREAIQVPNYSLPPHLEHYLEDVGPLYDSS